MEFVQQDCRLGGAQPIQTEPLGKRAGTGQDEFPVIKVVPVDVGVRMNPAGGRLSHLARPAEESHLPVALQVLREQGVVDSRDRHG